MTIVEALRESKERGGGAYMRVAVDQQAGFVRWVEGYTYKLVAEDLIADDWESVDTGIPKLTGGRWGAAG